MLAFMWWLVMGLIAGAFARLLIPGPQPMGLIKTMALGLVGSILGGFVSSLLYRTDPVEPGFHTSGLVLSTIGAAILLGLYVARSRRSQGNDSRHP